MSQHMLGSNVAVNYVDKRRSGVLGADPHTHITGETVFTGNAAGTTTTLLGADAAPATDDTNVVRRGEKFRLFDSAGDLKEETVFTIDDLASSVGTTTVTFSPAAAAATASGDVAKLVSLEDYKDEASLDNRLQEIDPTYFTDARLRQMNQNDKVWAMRSKADPGSI